MNKTKSGSIAVGAPGSLERVKCELAEMIRCRDNACSLANRLLADLQEAERAIEHIQEDAASGVSWVHVNSACNAARFICGRWRERENKQLGIPE